MMALLLAGLLAAPIQPQAELVLSDFESPGQWEGTVQSTDVAKQGRFSGKWEHMDKVPQIRARNIPKDWSRFNAISFWLYNKRRLPGTAVMFLIFSHNDQTPGIDYWPLRIDLSSWQGWRHFLLYFSELNQVRCPVGWHKIDSLEFSASGWGNTPNPQAVLYIDDVRLLKLPPREGPMVSDEEFFSLLDLSRPGLERVAAAVRRGDLEAAKAEFLAYLRARRTPRWYFDWRDQPKAKPPRKGSPGWDYFVAKFTVDWTGWKLIRLRLSDFGTARKPIGWDWITRLSFNSSGWGEQPKPGTQLYFDDIRLVGPEGSLVLEDFEDATSSFSGLVISRERVKSGKFSGLWADTAAVRSISLREPPRDWTKYEALEFWAYSPRATGANIIVVAESDDPNLSKAEAIMRHEFAPYGSPPYNKPYKFGPEIDWKANPFNYWEWTWGLNRHHHWRILADAYWVSGDEKYVRELVAQMMHWIRTCPPPRHSSGNPSPCWRTIECGIRMGQVWPHVLYRILGARSFTPEACVTMIKSMVDHARHLMRWRTGGNWLTMECAGLGTVGILFPEFKDAEKWRETAIETLYAELNRQVYPDGAQFELTTGYHHVALHNFLLLYRLAKLNNVPVPADYAERLKRMYYCDIFLAEPDWRTPAFNDGGRAYVLGYLREAREELYPDDPLIAWAATLGAEGKPPAETSHLFPYAGWMVMRSAWLDPDARYLCFEAGPYGYGHQHEDKLNIVVYGYGREHITDPGNYNYDSSPWRRYVLSTRAHNTIRIDGRDQNRRGLRELYVTRGPLTDIEWLSGPKLDYGAGIYRSGYGPKREVKVIHCRQVVFIKPDAFLVLDTLLGEGEHKIEALFHFDHDEAAAEGLTARTIDPDTSNCLIAADGPDGLALAIVKGQTEPEVQGFIPAQRWRPSWKNPDAQPPEHGKREIPTAVYTCQAQLPARLAFLIVPYPKGQRPEASVKLRPAQGGAAAEISLGGRRLLVLVGDPTRVASHPRMGRLSPAARVALYEWVDDRWKLLASLGGGT